MLKVFLKAAFSDQRDVDNVYRMNFNSRILLNELEILQESETARRTKVCSFSNYVLFLYKLH